MAVLVWVMVAIAFWHFTVFFPDRFSGGLVGAFVVAVMGVSHHVLQASPIAVLLVHAPNDTDDDIEAQPAAAATTLAA